MELRNADGERRRDERQRRPLPRVGRRSAKASASDGGSSSTPAAGAASVELDVVDGGVVRSATVDMGPVTFEPAEIPLDAPSAFDLEADVPRHDVPGRRGRHRATRTSSCSSTTSTTARVTQHGPHLEHDERFPKRHERRVRRRCSTADRLRMRVWERGVGETLSCGTGVCARRPRSRTGAVWSATSVVVEVPGGDAHRRRSATPSRLGGAVRHVFDVEVDARTSVVRSLAMSRERQARGRRRLTATEVDLEVVQQRALLVGTGVGTRTLEEAEASLARARRCSPTPRAPIPSRAVLQRRDRPDPATYVGTGKAEELRELAEGLDVDVVVFDDELTPAQQRNLEKLFGRDVVDRVALILDIFAQHATSQEGMVQVELAQLRYRLPAPARPRRRAEPAGRRHRHPRAR